MSASPARLAWPGAVFLAWLLAWSHLSAEWSADEQYRYGFGVPFLAAWMAWRRFAGPMSPAPPKLIWICGLAVALAMLILGEALRRHDPLWRFTGALLTAGAMALSVAWLHRRGGGALVRRQLFPLLFAATAVPWPVPVEVWTIHHLAAVVTDVATSLANLLGIAALQHGNTIELAKGVVGVDDACSGIQSLQATLMASLFLGEFFALRAAGRIALTLAGAAVSFFTNCGRVLTLTLLAHSRGAEAALEWHDLVGGSATGVTFGLLLAAAALLSRGRAALPAAPSSFAPARMPEGIAVFATVLAIPLAAHFWFSHFENAGPLSGKPSAWVLSDSHLPSGWTAEFVAPTRTVSAGLRFSEWQSFRVRSAAGLAAQVIRLAWKPGTRLPSFVSNHTPAVCMPAAGWIQSAPPDTLTLDVRGTVLQGVIYPFTREGARLLVFQSLCAGGRNELRFVDPTLIPGGFQRLAALWQAPLRQISEELLIYLPDPGDADARKSAATAILDAVLGQEHGR